MVPPKTADTDPRDPVAFLRQSVNAEGCNVRAAVFKYLEFAKARGISVPPASQEQKNCMYDQFTTIPSQLRMLFIQYVTS